jgi:DNA polymerase
MDARDLLRKYIEQRREVGETELVLDGLHVEEVMRLLGAAGKASKPASSQGSGRSSARTAESSSTDWRETLRDAGAGGEQPGATGAPAAPPAASVEKAAAPVERVGRLDFVPAPSSEAQIDSPFKKGLMIGNDMESVPDLIAQLPSLEAIAEKVQKCTRCPLYSTATNGVPGEGNVNADLVCVGEAPGANEDATGRPFVGQAGQLLTKILAAIDLKREEVFIVNVLKHRPPGNRNPRPEEVEACSPYLIRQLELIKPKVIVAFGTFAAQTLLQTKTPLGQLRGLVHRYHGTPLVVTYHPAALLRNPAWKRPTWDDVKLARKILDS